MWNILYRLSLRIIKTYEIMQNNPSRRLLYDEMIRSQTFKLNIIMKSCQNLQHFNFQTSMDNEVWKVWLFDFLFKNLLSSVTGVIYRNSCPDLIPSIIHKNSHLRLHPRFGRHPVTWRIKVTINQWQKFEGDGISWRASISSTDNIGLNSKRCWATENRKLQFVNFLYV
jgi:hypothetical protein